MNLHCRENLISHEGSTGLVHVY